MHAATIVCAHCIRIVCVTADVTGIIRSSAPPRGQLRLRSRGGHVAVSSFAPLGLAHAPGMSLTVSLYVDVLARASVCACACLRVLRVMAASSPL